MLMPPESMWTWLDTLLGERIGSMRPMLAIEQERRQKASALEKSVAKRTTEMNDCILRRKRMNRKMCVEFGDVVAHLDLVTWEAEGSWWVGCASGLPRIMSWK